MIAELTSDAVICQMCTQTLKVGGGGVEIYVVKKQQMKK